MANAPMEMMAQTPISDETSFADSLNELVRHSRTSSEYQRTSLKATGELCLSVSNQVVTLNSLRDAVNLLPERVSAAIGQVIEQQLVNALIASHDYIANSPKKTDKYGTPIKDHFVQPPQGMPYYELQKWANQFVAWVSSRWSMSIHETWSQLHNLVSARTEYNIEHNYDKAYSRTYRGSRIGMLANLGRIRQWCVIVFTELGNGDRPSHWSVYDGNRTINITPVGERQDMSPGTPWVKAAGVGRKRTVKKSVKPTKNELLARTNVEKFKKKKAKPKSKKAQMDVRMDAEEQQTPQAVAAKQAEDIISSLKREPKEPSEQDTFLQAQVNN